MSPKVAYAEFFADEQLATAIGFMSRALAWFNGQDIERDAVSLVVVHGR